MPRDASMQGAGAVGIVVDRNALIPKTGRSELWRNKMLSALRKLWGQWVTSPEASATNPALIKLPFRRPQQNVGNLSLS